MSDKHDAAMEWLANQWAKDDALAYAQQRADATRRPYIVTEMGHSLFDCPQNRALAEAELGGVAVTLKPVRL